MDLFLNKNEQKQLDDLVNHCQWAWLLWHISLPGKKGEDHFVVHRVDAREWKEVVDEERRFLPKAQGSLKRKVTELYKKIG